MGCGSVRGIANLAERLHIAKSGGRIHQTAERPRLFAFTLPVCLILGISQSFAQGDLGRTLRAGTSTVGNLGGAVAGGAKSTTDATASTITGNSVAGITIPGSETLPVPLSGDVPVSLGIAVQNEEARIGLSIPIGIDFPAPDHQAVHNRLRAVPNLRRRLKAAAVAFRLMASCVSYVGR